MFLTIRRFAAGAMLAAAVAFLAPLPASADDCAAIGANVNTLKQKSLALKEKEKAVTDDCSAEDVALLKEIQTTDEALAASVKKYKQVCHVDLGVDPANRLVGIDKVLLDFCKDY